MRHFLSYDADGKLTSQHGYSNAMTGMRGWPDGIDLDDPDTTNEYAIEWRNSRKKKPAGGYIRYECPCPPQADNCKCAGQARVGKFVKDGALTDKPAHGILVDGATYEPGTVLTRAPGADLVVKITCEDAPDGEILYVNQRSPQLMETSEGTVQLTYTDGAVPDIHIKAPAQGLTGVLMIAGKYCSGCPIMVKGWA